MQAMAGNPPNARTKLERVRMNWYKKTLKTNTAWFFIGAAIFLITYARSGKALAFNNNNGRNLPFCDTTMTPSWDPPGIWMEWCGRRWFVPDRNPGKAGRTFYQKKERKERLEEAYRETVTAMIRKSALHRAAKAARPADSNIEITYEDMQTAYALGSDFIEAYAFPENVLMDMGIEDPEFTAPQHWTLPAGLDFSTTLTRKIMDPEDTPETDASLEATHCLYAKSPNRGLELYEYFMLDEDGLWLVGQEAEDLDFFDYTDEEIMTLPLDYYTDYQSGSGELENWQADGDTTWYDDNNYQVDAWYYWSEAYGTIETPDDGPVEVIKIAYQWVWSDWQANEDGDDTLLDFDNGTEIYFYSKDGHQIMISIDSLGVETTGLVKPDAVYYQKVRNPGSSVEKEHMVAHPGFRVYPNPTRGMIHFDQPASFTLYDVLGRRVLSGKNADRADLSGLPRGLYFIKPVKGTVQKVFVQK
jgi:hypothetical protein